MEQLGLTVFDVAVIAVAIFGAAIGMSSGFAHSILFIASWLAAGWLAVHFSNVVQPQVQQLVANPELAYFVSILVVFVGALIVLVMLTNTFSRSIRSGPLAMPDRVLGAAFGALCAWLVMGTTFLFYGYLGPKQLPPAVEGGATFPMIKDMANFVEPYLPPGFRTRLQQKPADAMPDLTPAPQTAPPSSPTAPTDNKQSQ
jgi:membrane protein required for colicin V production